MALNPTPNFGLNRPPFDKRQYHPLTNANFSMIDAILARYVAQFNVVGVWANSTAYTIGDIVVDGDVGILYEARATHTSPASGTMADDREANPTRWANFSIPARFRGGWEANTAYSVGDLVVYQTKYLLCNTAHVSDLTIDLSLFEVLVDVGITATSDTNTTISNSALITFNTQADLFWVVGQRVQAASTASPANVMYGYVTDYSGESLTVQMTGSEGSGTFSAWTLALTGQRGPTGATGATGPVSSVSGNNANGFTVAVANPTTTPAITVGTSVTGLLKGSGTGVSAAVAGTDYALPGVDTTKFLVATSSNQTSVTGDNTIYTVQWPTEVSDPGNVFASNTFTVPTTGLYFLHTRFLLYNLGASHVNATVEFYVNGTTSYYVWQGNPKGYSDGAGGAIVLGSMVVSLTAADTVVVRVMVGNSTKTVNLSGSISSQYASFGGFLL